MTESRVSSERGAIIIQVLLAFLVLTAFLMFVVDYGVKWVSRNQAQNSADAGALAGAVALAYDDYDDRSDTGPAKLSARQIALSNYVFGQAPDVNITSDITFPTCPDGNDGCIKVDVYRNQARNNPLPLWFGWIVGLTNQGVRATATAQTGVGNTTQCLKPWAVVDKWTEHWEDGAPNSTWDEDSTYDKYDKFGNPDPNIPSGQADVYEAPTATSTGTGFHPFDPDGGYSADYGRLISLKTGDNGDFQFATGWFRALKLSDKPGGSEYEDNIKGCVGIDYTIGQDLEIDNEPGDMVGPTKQGVDYVMDLDPYAHWDPDMNEGRGGIAGSAFNTSPRIVAVPLINPDLAAEAQKGGRTSVPIANIMGFFLEGMDGKEVRGRLVMIPNMKIGPGGTVTPESAFSRIIRLIR
ncbi:MAG TPA: pilus assembly protein TadG-related protein [Vicinamibacterales bacterium]|nr:pilus assembly protein TadG-related protein [Vicinamibacterales bacterium]